MSKSQAERITALEVKVDTLERKVDEMNEKLDALLALRYKGAGAFALASALFGTGIVGFFTLILNYIKGD